MSKEGADHRNMLYKVSILKRSYHVIYFSNLSTSNNNLGITEVGSRVDRMYASLSLSVQWEDVSKRQSYDKPMQILVVWLEAGKWLCILNKFSINFLLTNRWALDSYFFMWIRFHHVFLCYEVEVSILRYETHT